MSSPSPSRSLRASLAVLMLLTAGCAVTTIDVDVYKGPLANHPDVQREQAAVTALAAKPLLIRLRYDLERLARYRWISGASDPALMELQRAEDYLQPLAEEEVQRQVAELVSKPRTLTSKEVWSELDCRARAHGQFVFQSSQAAYVNKILAEYNDRHEKMALAEEISSDPGTLPTGNSSPPSTQSTTQQSQQSTAQQSQRRSRLKAAAASFPARQTARGRPGPGLESLTYLYLQRKRDEVDEANGRIPEHRPFAEDMELFDGLIHFSQKVLFLANQDVLFSEKLGFPRAVTGGVDVVFNGGRFPTEVRDSYVRVLQAVGNSILVNLNELREQAAYQQVIGDATQREIDAVRAVWDRRPLEALEVMLDSLRAQRDDLARELKSFEDRNLAHMNKDVPAATNHATSDPSKSPGEAGGAGGGQNPATREADTQPAKQKPEKPEDHSTSKGESNKPPARIEELRQKVTKLNNALERIPVAAGAVASSPPGIGTDTAPFFVRLRQEIESRLNAATGAEKRAWTDARDVLDAQHLSNTSVPHPERAHDSKGVLDNLIAVLRQEQIEAVRRDGKDSPDVKRIGEALETAYSQRADMAYLRPASSYLRTSTPVTSLQRDARLGFRNLLAEHMSHQLPFADLFANGPDYRTVLELDKEYWHNINTVRVSGGGNTNYVIAKDDVGNWYVKNYSADPKDVIKSAQGLAKFALGPLAGGASAVLKAAQQNAAVALAAGSDKEKTQAIETLQKAQDAVGKSSKAASGGAATSPATQPAASTTSDDAAQAAAGVLRRELAAAAKAYQDQSATDAKQAEDDLAHIRDNIKAAWNNEKNTKTMLDTLTAAADDTPLDKPSGDTTITDSDRARNALQGMKRYYINLANQIRRKVSDPQAAVDVAAKAVRDVLDRDLKSRQDAASRYQAALDVIENGRGQ